MGAASQVKVCRALVSVFDKSGLDAMARGLSSLGVQIISSGGTAKAIKALGIPCTEVSEYTGYPESPGGLVKTLQPKIHGGLLLDPESPEHAAFMKAQGILPIDLVVVNLYPFTDAVSKPSCTPAEAHEMIDIGGPAMIRASAKGALLHGRPCVVVEPADYAAVLAELQKGGGILQAATVRRLAKKAFEHTAKYDSAIVEYMRKAPP